MSLAACEKTKKDIARGKKNKVGEKKKSSAYSCFQLAMVFSG